MLVIIVLLTSIFVFAVLTIALMFSIPPFDP